MSNEATNMVIGLCLTVLAMEIAVIFYVSGHDHGRCVQVCLPEKFIERLHPECICETSRHKLERAP